MRRKKYHFTVWCDSAVSKILFPPDQQMVAQELYDHLEDHCDALLAQGIPEEEAEQQALAAMGDPLVIAPQLAAIHRPFWGYFLRATRIALIILLCLTLIPLGEFIWEADYRAPVIWDFDLFDEASYASEERTLLYLAQPNLSETYGGLHFTLTDAVIWRNEQAHAPNEYLYLRLTQFHPLPWLAHGDVGSWFWAEDSLGNRYGRFYDHIPGDGEPLVLCRGSETSPFTHEYLLWINDYVSQEADWIDIRYSRDGRNLVFRVDLPGGDLP